MTEIEFEPQRAKTYRKTSRVLAFRSADAVTIHKDRGALELRAGAWLLVPLDDDGQPETNLHGVDGEEFEKTYEPCESGAPNQYVKHATVRAYQPGHAFSVDTKTRDHLEVDGATGDETSWLVQNPGGEVYVVPNDVFEGTYVEVSRS